MHKVYLYMYTYHRAVVCIDRVRQKALVLISSPPRALASVNILYMYLMICRDMFRYKYIQYVNIYICVYGYRYTCSHIYV